MPKLSTGAIKQYLQPKLPLATDAKDRIYSCFDAGEKDLADQTWKDWNNVNKWKRHSKAKLKEAAEDFFNVKYGFPIDHAGEVDSVLFNAIAGNQQQAENCIMRVFTSQNEVLADSCTIMVITNPADDQIVGWTAEFD